MSFRLCLSSLLAASLMACTAQAPTPAPAPAPATADATPAAWTQQCKDWDEWDQPGPPFRIYGNAWYVGTCGIAAILVTGDEGHILIDGGPIGGGALVAKNIGALGFKLSDVKILLHTHEHHDHVGGLAELQRRTGARLLVSPGAASVFETGQPAPGDPQLEGGTPIPPVPVAGQVADGQPVRLGALSLTPIFTPGHTPGALSWTWKSCEGEACQAIVYADSLSPISSGDYLYSDHPAYVAAFRKGIARIAAADCGILLAPHPSAADMRNRLIAGSLIDPRGCRTYADGITKRLDERLAKEASAN